MRTSTLKAKLRKSQNLVLELKGNNKILENWTEIKEEEINEKMNEFESKVII